MRARLRSWRPVRFFPDPAVSQQLIPLFEALGVSGVCRLACCNKAWKKTLDAWRATEATGTSDGA